MGMRGLWRPASFSANLRDVVDGVVAFWLRSCTQLAMSMMWFQSGLIFWTGSWLASLALLELGLFDFYLALVCRRIVVCILGGFWNHLSVEQEVRLTTSNQVGI